MIPIQKTDLSGVGFLPSRSLKSPIMKMRFGDKGTKNVTKETKTPKMSAPLNKSKDISLPNPTSMLKLGFMRRNNHGKYWDQQTK